MEEEKLRKELAALRKEHDDLDRRISRIHRDDGKNIDQLRIQRMKKRKLWVRDKILLVEKMLYPDISA